MPDTLQIEVVTCPPGRTGAIQQLQVVKGCTAMQAIEQSSILVEAGLTREKELQIGIFGKRCKPDTALHNLDRVEIYRPLLLSPTEARRLRAQTLEKK